MQAWQFRINRGGTTVLNAYRAPPLQTYLKGPSAQLYELDPRARFELMQSNGGLAALERFRAFASVLFGSAGGPIGFAMSGTSSDLSLLDGQLPRRFEHRIAGVQLQQTILNVHTSAAGARQLRRADGSAEPIGATASFAVEDGDEMNLLTPGGGGLGMQP